MKIPDMVKNWEAWGTQDPMFAILTDPDKAEGRWNEQEFFSSGEKRVEERLKWLETRGIKVQHGLALDFGCGIGRLTNPLAKHFKQVHGVDVSASMIERARRLCRFPDRIEYFQNTASDLSAFRGNNYDLIYSELVLQHIPPRYQLSYIEDFLRLLSPKGLAYFQTIRAVGWRSFIPDRGVELYRSWKHHGKAFFPMYAVSPKAIEALVSVANCRILAQETFPPRAAANRFWCDVYVVGRVTPAQSNPRDP